MSIKNLKAAQIKSIYNGMTKKAFIELMNANNLKPAKNQSALQYINSAAVRNIITASDRYKTGKERYETRQKKEETRQTRIIDKEAARQQIGLYDRSGYDRPVTFPISRFSDYGRYRVAYNKPDQSNAEEMYNNLREFRNSHVDNDNKLHSMVIYIRNRNSGKMRYITIQAEQIRDRTYKRFLEMIDERIGKENKNYGSDHINDHDEYIDFSRFDVFTKSRQRMNGVGSIKFFKTAGINGGKEGLCVYYCLQRILGNDFMSVKDFKQRSLNELEGLAEWIKDNNHQINLILTTPKLTDELFNMSEENEVTVKIGKFTTDLYRASIENATYIYPYGCFFPESDHTIFIDIDGKHADLPLDNIVQMNDFLFAESGNYYMKNENGEYEKTEYSEKQLYIEGKRITIDNDGEYIINNKPQVNGLIKAKKIEQCYIFYDYETVINFTNDNPIIPVSLAFVEVKREVFDGLSGHEKDDFINNLLKIKKDVLISHGRDCTKLLDQYISESIDKTFTLISFNGARFDHYILYNELTRPDMRMHQNISNVFFVKNDLLNFKIHRRHELFDLCKHVKSSLERACEDYGIDLSLAKKKLDFFEIQQLYDTLGMDKFIEKISDRKNVVGDSYNEYIAHDIISMIAVMHKYSQSINSILKIDDITKHKTSGGMMTHILDKHLYKKQIKLPLFKKEQAQLYKDLKRSQVGGRVDAVNGVQKIFEQVASGDCSGMYPYVMAVLNVYYPHTAIKEIDSYEELPKNTIGFFYCSGIDQSHLESKIHPKKVDNCNDWHTTEIINDVLLSTVRINWLKREGCPMTIGKGFYFTGKVKSCELFTFILDFMKTKTEQDNLKENKDPKYNESLRKTVKELMLILSGKLGEGLYLNKFIVVDEQTFNNEYRFNDNSEFVSTLSNGNAVINLEVSEEDALRHSKPIYITTLIYDYAQEYMYYMKWNRGEHNSKLYIDTDCEKELKESFDKWAKWALTQPVPHWPEVEKYDPRYKTAKLFAPTSQLKVIGSIADEYKDRKINFSYTFQKKRYCDGHTDEPDKVNFKFNGIRNTDIFITDDKLIETYKKANQKDLFYAYHQHKNTHAIKNNYIAFLDCLADKKKCHVLVSSVTKNKNSIDLSSSISFREIVLT